MRTRYRYDADLDAVIEIRDGSNFFEETPQGPSVISDDVGAGVKGLRHMPTGRMLDSKSAFREADRRAGRECVGTETHFESKQAPPHKDFYGEKVRDAYEQFQSNYNGTADRVRNERLRRV